SPKEESSPVPAIKLDLLPENKSSDVSEPVVDKDNKERNSFNKQFNSKPGAFGSAGSSNFRSFSFESKMSNEKPSTSMGPLRASYLRPPQLASPDKFGSTPALGENATKYSFALKPARLNNPFAKAKDTEEASTEPGENLGSEDKPSVSNVQGAQPPVSLPKFVPLGSPLPPTQPRVNTSSSPAVPSTSAASGFVFGQNLHEKVSDAASADTTVTEKNEIPEAVNNGASSSSTAVGSNGTSENLFTSVLKKEQGEKSNDSGGENSGDRPNKSLSEAAKEYEESRAVKRKYEEVAVVTGEEDELNILQINCKLFAFDKVKSSWAERGRGNLRLNDKESGTGQKQSRIIMRTAGSFRVILNTKLWPGMVVEKVSSKSVRLTAMDAISGEVLVFLVMASPKDADFLFNYLDSRVTSLKTSCAESASRYPDASRKNNLSGNATETRDSDDTLAKKRAVDTSGDESENNHVSKADSRDSQDTGGSDDSVLEKISGNDDISNSTGLS
ncbi:Ran-binding protein 3, partial [Frankliniella fusca]